MGPIGVVFLLIDVICIILSCKIGRNKGYSLGMSFFFALFTGPIAVIALVYMPWKNKTEVKNAASETAAAQSQPAVSADTTSASTAPAAAPVPRPAAIAPVHTKKSFAEMKTGEAFLHEDRPVILLEKGDSFLIVSDFKNGLIDKFTFAGGYNQVICSELFNIPVISVKAKAVHPENGEREFTDAKGDTVTFLPCLSSEVVLDSAEEGDEIQLAKFEGRYYVVSVRHEGVLQMPLCLKLDLLASTMNKKALFLIDNEIYHSVERGMKNSYTACRYSDGTRKSLSVYFTERVLVSHPSEYTWIYTHHEGGIYYFMDNDTFKFHTIEAYRLPRLPGEEEMGNLYNLTFAFGRVIRMEKA